MDGRPTAWRGAGVSRWLLPDDDLAPNRPGEALLTDAPPAAAPRSVRRAHRDRRWSEERVGAALDGLAALGWHTLHSVPLPGRATLAHLTIGPGGIFAVRAARCPARRVTVDGDGLHWRTRGGRRRFEPEVRLARRAAARAEHALARAGAGRVPVVPVLALAGPGRVRGTTADRAERSVRVCRDREIPALGARAGVLHPDTVEGLYALARDRRPWQEV